MAVSKSWSVLLVCLVSLSSVLSVRYINNGLFERYSKMKLLSECLGQNTVARWRQQVITASKECEKNPPFIAALLHQLPTLTVQRNPPDYFVPNMPSINHFILSNNQRDRPQHPYVTSPNSYRTFLYLRQPITSVIYPQRTSYLPWSQGKYYVSPGVGPSNSNYKTLPEGPVTTEEETSGRKMAGQKESYTNPNLQYEDTIQYQQEQDRRRQIEINEPPFKPSTPFIDTLRLQKRSAEPTSEHRSFISKEQNLRHLLRSRVTDRISNMTCVMKALRMVNENLEPDIDFLRTSLLELPISDEVYEDLNSGINYCESESSCRFTRPMLHEMPIASEFSSSLEFFKCFGKERLRSCLKANVEGMVRLMERETVVDPISGFYEPESQFISAVGELEDLLTGNSGHFVDMLLL